MSDDDLEPMEPVEAVEMWMDHLQSTRANSTLRSYRYRVEPFVEWCAVEGIDNLNDLTSRDVFRYEAERRSEDLTVSTLKNQIGTLKQLLAFCSRINAVEESLPQKMEVPTSEDFRDFVNETKLQAARAEKIEAELSKFQYASRRHAMFTLLWHTGCRVGGLRGLDVDDLYFHEEDLERLRHRGDVDEDVLEIVELPFVFFQHRPDTEPETRLKNKYEGERPVALDEAVAEVVDDYVRVNRPDRQDVSGRRPLFTTERGENGRVSTSSVRREVYIVTQPCHFGDCPHDRDPEQCEATEYGLEARCPSSRSPHPIRAGRITDLRDKGWPPEVVGERVDATPETIRLHYDLPDKIRRMQSRRKYLREKDS